MVVQSFRSPVVKPGDDLFTVLRETLPLRLPEKCVVAITSKIVALAENRVVAVENDNDETKHKLVRQEAEYYLEPSSSRYNVMLSIKNGLLAVSAGIDESNTNGWYVLWPEDCQQVVNDIWSWLRQEYQVKEVGVILTDSKTTPLFWGVTGASIAHSGFLALSDKRNTPDIFGRALQMTQVNVSQALAAAAVFQMGETNEQTPVAILTETPDIVFQDHIPTPEELDQLKIELADDVYAPFLTATPWEKGGAGQKQS